MKVGIVGLGAMGLNHAEHLRTLEFVTEVVGCDLSAEIRARAEGKGIRAVSSVEALLEEQPFAAIVATPPTSHAAVIRQCFAAGVPVLTEKPMTTEIREGRELVALAAEKGLNFQVGFELPYNGSMVGMWDIVNRGLIGTPQHMSLVQLRGASPRGWTKARNGGVFYEKLCHEIDLFRSFFGEPERVMAVAGPRVLEHYDVPDNVLACLRFPDGRQGTITFLSTRAAHLGGTDDHGDRGHYCEIILTGTEGSVSHDMWTETLEVVRFNHRGDHRTELVESINIVERYGKGEYNVADQDRDFLERTRDGKPLRFPAANAQISMEWVERAERSLSEAGKWIGAE